jgi:hypothetical protein
LQGDWEGHLLGIFDGVSDGLVDGDFDGNLLGFFEGDLDGLFNRDWDCDKRGLLEGDLDELFDGDFDGKLLGLLEGDFDGQRRHSNKDGKLSEISNNKYIGYVYILPVILFQLPP